MVGTKRRVEKIIIILRSLPRSVVGMISPYPTVISVTIVKYNDSMKFEGV